MLTPSARHKRARSTSMFWRWSAPLVIAALVGGCASAPTGPSVMVLPGLGKSFEQFNADDAVCRQWGLQATGRSPAEAATTSSGTSATAGTAIGDAGGPASGATAAPSTGGTTYSGQEGQWRYDMAYQQCMYSRGHQIPGVPAGYRGVSAPAPSPALTPKPLDSSAIPPPPPGPPPPPPPGVSR